MINRNDFISRYLVILKKHLEDNLPQEDILLDMCEKADKIIRDKLKRK